jgi:glycerophosphoryl diester phosphodiesterase
MMIKKPLIIGHRGASGDRPEHTLASYELAIEMGADYIEPDLVITKDGVLVARHENEISQTTDIANHPEFAHRQTTKIIDGTSYSGWFTEDFTLQELKTLRAKERIPHIRPQNTTYDGLWEIPTFQEIINLAQSKTAETGRIIGIYPETKHPSYFQSIGLPLETTLLQILKANGYEGSQAPVFIQSFEVSNLKYLANHTDLPLIQLINDSGQPYDFVVARDSRDYKDLVDINELKKISEYAKGIGVNKNLIAPRDCNGKLKSPTSLVENAHDCNLQIHAWTFRKEDNFLPLDFQGNPQGEYELFFNLGVDGVFSDNPNMAKIIRDF